jgi:hypothetical protein
MRTLRHVRVLVTLAALAAVAPAAWAGPPLI